MPPRNPKSSWRSTPTCALPRRAGFSISGTVPGGASRPISRQGLAEEVAYQLGGYRGPRTWRQEFDAAKELERRG